MVASNRTIDQKLHLLLATHPDGLSWSDLDTLYKSYNLPNLNPTRARKALLKHRDVFQRDGLIRIREPYRLKVLQDAGITSADHQMDASKFIFPNLNDHFHDASVSMAYLYRDLFLFENSVRVFMEQHLSRYYGTEWWTHCSNSTERRKHDRRIEKELSKKWLPSRSELGPLYSLDWLDLANIIERNWDDVFVSCLKDENFIHRFSDLYGIRNLVAHNGYFDDEDVIQRIRLSISDWIKQIN